MREVKTIPKEVTEYIDRYLHLNIRGEDIPAPYYINTSGILKQSVLAGKGSPQEIEATANALLANHSFEGDLKHKIRKEMENLGLGIDCSGLIYHAYNKWLKDILGKGELKHFLPNENILNPRKFLSRKLKPESSVSAHMVTSEPFAEKVEVKDTQPGDLIRTRGGKHVLLITEVEYENKVPVRIKFVNSTTSYERNGVRYGEILLSDDLNLANAQWRDLKVLDNDDDGGFAYKGYRELINNNGIWRLKLPV